MTRHLHACEVCRSNGLLDENEGILTGKVHTILSHHVLMMLTLGVYTPEALWSLVHHVRFLAYLCIINDGRIIETALQDTAQLQRTLRQCCSLYVHLTGSASHDIALPGTDDRKCIKCRRLCTRLKRCGPLAADLTCDPSCADAEVIET